MRHLVPWLALAGGVVGFYLQSPCTCTGQQAPKATASQAQRADTGEQPMYMSALERPVVYFPFVPELPVKIESRVLSSARESVPNDQKLWFVLITHCAWDGEKFCTYGIVYCIPDYSQGRLRKGTMFRIAYNDLDPPFGRWQSWGKGEYAQVVEAGGTSAEQLDVPTPEYLPLSHVRHGGDPLADDRIVEAVDIARALSRPQDGPIMYIESGMTSDRSLVGGYTESIPSATLEGAVVVRAAQYLSRGVGYGGLDRDMLFIMKRRPGGWMVEKRRWIHSE